MTDHRNDPLRPPPAVLHAHEHNIGFGDYPDESFNVDAARIALGAGPERDADNASDTGVTDADRFYSLTTAARELPDAILTRAEYIADTIRAEARAFSQAAWELDAALSAIRKDKVGYRIHNAANLDGAANYAAGQLSAARAKAALLLSRLATEPQPFNVA